ncbi:MAG: hypothetical protein ACP5OO_09645 [Chloroflexia bacterium]
MVYDYYGAHSHPAVQNQTAQSITATVDFIQGISPTLTLSTTIPPFTSWFLDGASLPSGFLGEAFIHAGDSFFAVDHQVTSDAAVAYHGLAQAHYALYCPELYYDYNGWNSSIDVYNPNQVTATVAVAYPDGISLTAVLGPGAHHIFDQSLEGHLPGSRLSGMVTADPPVMALCSCVHYPNGARLYEAAAGGFTETFVPYLGKPGPEPALWVMNPGTSPVTVTIGGSLITIPPGETWAEDIFPPGYAGGTGLESTGEVIVIAHVDGPAGPGDPASAYTVQAQPYPTLFFPFAPRNIGLQGYTWNAMLVIQNTSPEIAQVMVTFYDEFGSVYSPVLLGAPGGPIGNPFLLDPGNSQPILLSQTMELPDGRFSAVAASDRPLVGMALLEGYSPLLGTGGRAVHLRWSGPRMR